jgi:hypothetical protein
MRNSYSEEKTSSAPVSRSRLVQVTWLMCCFGAAAVLAWRAFPARTAESAPLVRVWQTSIAQPITKPIEQIRVGDRVKALNPELDASRRYVREVDAPNWRRLHLRSVKPDGSAVDIQLLREVDWVEAMQAQPGKLIELNLNEFGADGFATVLAVAPCPPIAGGKGLIVTGTYEHSARSVIDVQVEGGTSIGCTSNHLFWSEDRFSFVPAGQLKVGEKLRTSGNSVASVAAISPRIASEKVYNLEVDIENVYYVSNLGVLVHNTCHSKVLGNNLIGAGGARQLDLFTGKALEDAAHVVPAGAMTGRSAYIQGMVARTQAYLVKNKLRVDGDENGIFVDKLIHRSEKYGYHRDDVFKKVGARVRLANRHGPAAMRQTIDDIASAMKRGELRDFLGLPPP